MRILALDTATEACSAALLVDGRLLASREMEFERGHAEHILAMIDAVLAEGGVALPAVDAVAFGRGPGGFTGVRLAASVTQGLAFAADRFVVPISDLAAVAQRALDLEPAVDRVLVCNDARMKEVYWACFERDREGLAALVGAERVGPPETVELPATWQTAPAASAGEPLAAKGSPLGRTLPEPTSVASTRAPSPPRQDDTPAKGDLSGARAAPIGAIGRGFRAYRQLRSKLLSESTAHTSGSSAGPPSANEPSSADKPSSGGGPRVRLISDDLLPRAHEIARLAVREIEAGRLVRPEDAIPVYLRDDVARPKPP
jgi:tRNA threonylcarbamoyl adenosine modification protein YeaZ